MVAKARTTFQAVSSAEKRQLIRLGVMLAMMILFLATVLFNIGGDESGDKKDESKSAISALFKDSSYARAKTPPALPDCPPFTAKENAFEKTVDAVPAAAEKPWDEAAQLYLLHQSFSLGQAELEKLCGNVAVGKEEYQSFITESADKRGKARHWKGSLETFWERKLPEGNILGLELVYEGFMRLRDGERLFFQVLQYPQNLYRDDPIYLDGFFMQFASLRVKEMEKPDEGEVHLTAPMILGYSLQLCPAPSFAPDETIISRVDDEDGDTKTWDREALGYLLHKLRSEPQDALRDRVDPKIRIEHMLGEAARIRGKAVRVKAFMLAPAIRKNIPENPSGIRWIYHGYIGNTDQQMLSFICLEPPLFQTRDLVELEGYYLQRITHTDSNKIHVTTPLVVALRLKPARESGPDSSGQPVVWFFGIGIVLIVLMMIFWSRWEGAKADEVSREVREKLRPKNLDLNESAKKLVDKRQESLKNLKIPNRKLKDRDIFFTRKPQEPGGANPPPAAPEEKPKPEDDQNPKAPPENPTPPDRQR